MWTIDKAFNIAKNARYDRYQRGLAAMVYKFFDKKTAGGAVKNEIMENKELAEELHKPIIRKFEIQKVGDTQLISKFNTGIHFFCVCVIDICSKYAWVIPLKNEIGITITNDESGRKPSKIWVDKGTYIDKLDNIVNKYNHAYHRTVKMKVGDAKSRTSCIVDISL